MSQIIVIDIYSVVPDLQKTGSKLTGVPVKDLVSWVKAAQDQGHTIYFVCGAAHDAYMRQMLERYLEGIGIRAVFVTHGVPDGFNWFVSKYAFPFDGKHFPTLITGSQA